MNWGPALCWLMMALIAACVAGCYIESALIRRAERRVYRINPMFVVGRDCK